MVGLGGKNARGDFLALGRGATRLAAPVMGPLTPFPNVGHSQRVKALAEQLGEKLTTWLTRGPAPLNPDRR